MRGGVCGAERAGVAQSADPRPGTAVVAFSAVVRRSRAPLAWTGPGLGGAFGFSAKAIFAKLAYAASPIDAITVLTFRMLFSLPFCVMIGWRNATRSARGYAPRLGRHPVAGVHRLLPGEPARLPGLEYISASLERLILFLNPTIVVLFSALVLGKPVTRRTPPRWA